MASYRGHLTFSTGLGAAYFGLSWWQLHVAWPVAAVGGVLTALGGLLPDLDSDSGVPVREMFNLAATFVPLMLISHASDYKLSIEQVILFYALIYMAIRFGVRALFKHVTVHRGMFHSIPAMLISGLIVYLAYHHPSMEVRAFMAVGVMLGFLSHLVLDELCSVDFRGLAPKLNHFAGTAVKLYSPSMAATGFTYVMLAGLGYLAWKDFQVHGYHPSAPVQQGPMFLPTAQNERIQLPWQSAANPPQQQPPTLSVPGWQPAPPAKQPPPRR